MTTVVFGRLWPVWLIMAILPIMSILGDYFHLGRLLPLWQILAILADYDHCGRFCSLWPIMACCGRFVLFYKLCKYLTTNTEKNLKILKYHKSICLS